MPRRPSTGWRDGVALLATAFGIFGAGIAAVLLSRSPYGLVAAPAAGALGYSKQFWRTAFKRRPRLRPMPAPSLRDPDQDAITGTAMPFEQTLEGGALAIATTIEAAGGVIVRAIEAVPFWLALPDRRVLIAGDCWLAGEPEVTRGVSEVLLALGARELPIDRGIKKQLRVARVRLIPGDRASVYGRVREEQLPGGGGYRDALVEVVRGEPGASNWIAVEIAAAKSGGVARARREDPDAGA